MPINRKPVKPNPSQTLRLEWVDPKTLGDNPAKWRVAGKGQMETIAALIADVGWAGVLLFNERTKHLLDGHKRKELAIAKGGMVPVVIGSWSVEKEKLILATLHASGDMSKVDDEALEALLQQVHTDDATIAALLNDVAIDHGIDLTGEVTEDDIPEPPAIATTKLGDLIILGNHRLFCGDSSKPEQLDKLLSGQRIHLVNTDPPYNVAVEPRSNNAIAAGNSSFASGKKKHYARFDKSRNPTSKATTKELRPKDRQLANDALTEAAYSIILGQWFANVARVLVPGRAFYIWGGYANTLNYRIAMEECELHFAQSIIWVKHHPVLGRKDFMSDHEWCFYGWRSGAAHQFFGPNNIADVWEVTKVSSQKMVHLTEKPVELAARAIQYSSRSGENVLDLFGGSGSTLIAAEQANRHAFLMELDPLYCDVIVERWENFTGKKAKRPRAKGKAA